MRTRDERPTWEYMGREIINITMEDKALRATIHGDLSPETHTRKIVGDHIKC